MMHREQTRYTKTDPHPLGKFPASTAPTDRDVMFILRDGARRLGRMREDGWVYLARPLGAERYPVDGGPYANGPFPEYDATHWAEPIT